LSWATGVAAGRQLFKGSILRRLAEENGSSTSKPNGRRGVDHAVRNGAPHSKYKYFASDVRRADADTSRVPAIGKKVMSDYRQLLDKLKDY
jgi:hypothetical protein